MVRKAKNVPANAIRPQPKQEEFLSTPADVALFGGGAGGGKSYALELEPSRHVHKKKFTGLILRRTSPELTEVGGLWDTSYEIYPHLGGLSNVTSLKWLFPPHKSVIRFGHIQHEKDLLKMHSAQITYLGFDELTTFSEYMFWYMFSRNRSTSGVVPYIRGTCNPDPDSFVRTLVDWYIDPQTGYAIPERSGLLRWFLRDGEDLIWASDRDDLWKYTKGGLIIPQSFTFVPALVHDNPKLLEKDPAYISKLMVLPPVEQERLLRGNWKIRAAAGLIFNRSWYDNPVQSAPSGGVEVLYWDLASTEKKITAPDPDFTAATSLRLVNGRYYVTSCVEFRKGVADTLDDFKNLSIEFVNRCRLTGTLPLIRWEREGGGAGKRDSYNLVQLLPQFDTMGILSDGDKFVRARPFISQSIVGNVRIVEGSWNERWLNHLHNQPSTHDDIMDSTSGAYNAMQQYLAEQELMSQYNITETQYTY